MSFSYETGEMLLKKLRMVLSVLFVLSLFVTCFSQGMQVMAGTTKKKLIKEDGLSVSYAVKMEKQSTDWQLFLEHASEDDDVQQRMKLKIVHSTDEVIDYPDVKGFSVEDDWLIEEKFTQSMEKKMSLQLPKDEGQLKLYVQLDEERMIDGKAKRDENVLSSNAPYILESESVKEEPVVPLLPTKATALAFDPLQTRMYDPIYTNKEPEYTTEDGNVYPTYSWQPEGQANVMNHQGGFTSEAGWDGVTSWDVTDDRHDQSYIHYGENSTDANIAIRKYVQQTDQADEFKVKLNVRGNVTNKPGMDIVFLLDNSDSMDPNGSSNDRNNKRNAEQALEKIIDELKKVHNPAAKNIRIGGHIFSDYTVNAWGSKSGEKRTFNLSNNTADWDNLAKEYKKAVAMGATFTQRGLKESQDIFKDANDTSDRKQILFVLTDGSPNHSWVPRNYTPSEYMYYDKYYLSGFDTGSKGNYKGGNVLGAKSYTTKIQTPYAGIVNSHITPMTSTAYDLKAEGIEIHTISVQIAMNINETHTKAELLRGLYKMATKRADSTNGPDDDSEADYFFHNVENPGELVGTFEEWYQTIVRTVDEGVLTDPLGDMVELVDTPTWKEVGTAKAIEDEDKPVIEVTDNNRQINVKNINLTGKQELEIEYTVKLKTDAPAFVSSQWYPANKRTTLEPTPGRSTDKLDFGVPSVRAVIEDFVVPVEKNWEDTVDGQQNYWEIQPNEITAVLQRKEGSTWQDKHQITLNADNDWKGNFPAVEGGDKNTYRVIEKVADKEKVAGYKAPTYSHESFTSETLEAEGVTITNELMTTNYSFKKVGHDGQTLFSGENKPAFAVKDKKNDQLVLQNLTPNDQGIITLTGLPIGTYEIEETKVPEGYQKMANILLEVTENQQGTDLLVTANNQSDSLTVSNKLQDFTLIVNKVDDFDNPLEGAKFKLTGNTTSYEDTQTLGPTFTFTGLQPDVYQLEELSSPGGYVGLSDRFTFTLSEDGSVQLGSDPLVSGSGGITSSGNKIELTVKNNKQGKLPYTGHKGRRLFFIVAAGVMVAGLILCGAYYQVNKMKKFK